MTVKAFIFDLDGVLTDTADYHFIAWQATAHHLGLEFTREDNEALKGVDRVGSLQLILDKGKLTISEEKFQQLLVEKNKHYLELINDINPGNLFPGVLDCFAALKANGIKIGLASASKNAAFVVDQLGIADLFDFIGDAASVANSKPAPDIFLSVAQGLGLSPEDCLGVEDAVAGVSAIKAAGMYAVGIGEKSVLTQADIVFPTTGEMDVQQLLSRAL